MKNFKFKYLTDGDCKALDKMIAEGHQDTLVRFGCECINYWKIDTRRQLFIGALIGGAAGALLLRCVRKYQEATEEKEEEKVPEHDFVMV